MSDQHQRPVSERPYDLVIYGASGFVGRQAVRYLAEHAPHRLRWAVADISRERLEALKFQIGGSATSADVFVTDSRNQPSVDAVVSCARVILSTAGPFAIHSDPVVDACVRLKTHYVDITGETLWVKDLIVRYHDRAAMDGIRIVPGCGYDSVPSDLGTFLLVRQMQRELGVPCREVKAYFQMYGGFNGATISGPMPELDDPFFLNPPGAHPNEEVERSRDPHAVRYDEDVGTWVGPHFMGPINTRVVRRSCALYEQWQAPYGARFVYQEYLKFDPPFARFKAIGATVGWRLLQNTLRRPLGRRFVASVLPAGTGPSERTMNRGWFDCQLTGFAEDGRMFHGLLRDRGDPSNRVTAKTACEAALSLALDEAALPGAPTRGGILTPATALGEVLAKRLRDAGMTLEFGSAVDDGAQWRARRSLSTKP